MRFFFTSILLVAVTHLGLAQNPLYVAIDKSKGLPSNTVYDLFEDRNGFIWIGHDKGLSQYDGRQFKHFQNQQQNGKALSNILQDGQGKIWCQSFSGQVFYTSGDSLVFCDVLEPTGLYSVSAMVSDSVLVVASKNGLRKLNTETLHVTHLNNLTLSSNHFAFGRNNEYNFFNRDSGTLTTLTGNTAPITVPAPVMPYFYALRTHTGNYYIAKFPAQETNILKATNQKLAFQFPKNTFVHNVEQVNDSTVAILTATGFYLFDANFELINQQVWFRTKKFSSILQDREGNWWAGTLNEGILFIPSLYNKQKFQQYSFSAIEAVPGHSDLWMGTADNELLQYDTRSGKISLFNKQKLNHEVTAIHINTKNNTLAFASDQVYFFQNNKPVVSFGGSIKDIAQLSTDEYVLGTSLSTTVLSLPGKSSQVWSTHYPIGKNIAPPGQLLNTDAVRARAVAVMHDTIYSATPNSLIAYTSTANWEVTYRGQSVSVSDLTTDDSQVYVASFTKGLFKIVGGQLQKLFDHSDSNLTNIYKISVYKNMLWALTENDVRSYSLATGNVNIIDQSDGLPADDIRDFALSNDTLYLAGNGLIYFPVTQKPLPQHAPRIVLNNLWVNGENVNLNEPLSFNSTQNDLLITYSVLAYKELSQVKIFYRINEGAWQSLENASRELRLPALSPAQYAVTIKVVSKNGLESVEPIQLNFTIHKPFFKEVWFVVVLVVMLIVGLYSIHRYRLKKLEEKNKIETDRLELEQALQQSLLASIKSQMNPHFIYNALSSIQSFVYADDKTNAIKYLDSFSTLMRQVLEMSNRETILLSEELMILETYISLEKMRFGNSFQYTITCDPDLDQDYVRLPSMIVQPFVENAIKHGLLHRKGDKKLDILLRKKDEHNLEIIVDDNGVGRKTSGERQRGRKTQTSFSTGANRTRLSLLNTKPHAGIGLNIIDKTDDAGQSNGTRVVIIIPHVVS